jgi:hypothetical protein
MAGDDFKDTPYILISNAKLTAIRTQVDQLKDWWQRWLTSQDEPLQIRRTFPGNGNCNNQVSKMLEIW